MAWAGGVCLGSALGQAQARCERDTFRVDATQNGPTKRTFLGPKRNERDLAARIHLTSSDPTRDTKGASRLHETGW